MNAVILKFLAHVYKSTFDLAKTAMTVFVVEVSDCIKPF